MGKVYIDNLLHEVYKLNKQEEARLVKQRIYLLDKLIYTLIIINISVLMLAMY